MPLLAESEILNEYAKVLEQSGFVSNAEEKAKDDGLSVPEILYGVKPNGKEYDRNIMELAHPETVVIIPAIDAMDGVVENNNQRQDVMNYIARKTPDGVQFQRRYVSAHEDLVKSIVRAGFKLDNDNDLELMKLADSCAGRLEKKGFWMAALPWIAGGLATLLGSIAWINNTADSRQNILANADKSLAQLNDLQGKMQVENIIADINDLKYAATTFETVKLDVFSPQAIMSAAKNQAQDIKASQEYQKKLSEMSIAIPQYITQLETLQPHEENESSDWIQKIKDIARAIVPTDATEAIHALEGLAKAVQKENESVNYIMAKAKGMVPEIQKQIEQQHPQEQPKQEDSVSNQIMNSLNI